MDIEAEATIRPEHRRRFRTLADGMAKLLRDIRKYCPEAQMYLEDSGNWNLMIGPSHDDNGNARHDRVAAFVLVPHSDGGAW